jgi:hypothetical protein
MKIVYILSVACLLIAMFSEATFSQDRIVGVEQLTSQGVQYERMDFGLEVEASYQLPYVSEEISLDFKALTPAGKEIVVPAFYHSDAEGWRIRFTPRESGVYQYHIALTSGGALVDESVVDNFEVIENAEAKGFLSPNNFRTFKFDNGEYFRGIGINVGWEGRSWDEPAEQYSYDHYLDQLSRNGANFIRTWMCQWNFPLEWQTVSQTNRYSNRTEYFHPEAIARLDEFVELADDHDIYVMLCLEVHGSIVGDEWLDSPYNIDNGGPCESREAFFTDEQAIQKFKNRLRYIVGRWGYSPNIAVWELFNEIDNVSAPLNISANVITSWHAEMSSYLKEIDPSERMVSTSISHRDIGGLNSISAIDFNQKHIYHDSGDASDIISTLENYTSAFQKPYVIGECGWTWDWNKDFSNPQTQENLIFDFKRSLWYGVFHETPIYPMSWWWEFFEEQSTFYYFQGVEEITADMLTEGDGNFQKVNATASDSEEAYAVKAGENYYAYLLNKTYSEIETNLQITTSSENVTFYVQEYNPENQLAINLGEVNTNQSGIADLASLSVPGRHGTVFILSVEERPENSDIRIEAERFSNTSGVNVAACSDIGEGDMVSNVQDMDWLTYDNINLPYAGEYIVEYRISNTEGGGVLQLEEAGNPENAYGTLNIPVTGGEKVWQTVQHSVTLSKGMQSVGLKIIEGGWSINWLSFRPVVSSNLETKPGLRDRHLIVYPNPSNGNDIKFGVTMDKPGTVLLSVFNAQGQKLEEILQKDLSQGFHTFPLSRNLKSGSYFVGVETGTEKYSSVFVVR